MRPAYNELTRLPHLSTIATGNNAPLHLGTTGDAHAFKKITYPGINNKSEFVYGPTGGRVKIVETVSGSVTSTKQFIGGEERDGSGNVTKQFFSRGQRNGSSNFFYCRDHLGSVRTMTDNSGASVSDRSFDPYGRASVLTESTTPDFGFAGLYMHSRSGLNLAMFRVYNPVLGCWLGRDPLGESEGPNLYNYVTNDPVLLSDPSGLTVRLGPSRGLPDPSRWSQAKRDEVDRLSKRLDDFLTEAKKIVRAYQRVCGGALTRGVMGTMIDGLVKSMIDADPELRQKLSTTGQGLPGPDIYSPTLDVWWDVTTNQDWDGRSHQRLYDAKYGYGIGVTYNFVPMN